MSAGETNRFQRFFHEGSYTNLKNLLYNYRLRKLAVKNALSGENREWTLEAGSGLSPVVPRMKRTLYCDFSFKALRQLRQSTGERFFVVADLTRLPFKSRVFSHAVCSEVLEHINNDCLAMSEMGRVLKAMGKLVVTFPHRQFYYSSDDHFVNHYRRYELSGITGKLSAAGFQVAKIKKVLGPLEKGIVTILVAIFVITRKKRFGRRRSNKRGLSKLGKPLYFAIDHFNRLLMALLWVDAFLAPRFMSTVLLISAIRKKTCQKPIG